MIIAPWIPLSSLLFALSLPLFRSRLKTIVFDHGLVLLGRERLSGASPEEALYTLHIFFARTSTKQIRAFSVVVPSTWNGLPSELRIFNRTTSPAFFSHLKTALFDRAGVGSASEWFS